MNYWFDERGHLRNDKGEPEMSDDEICRRLGAHDACLEGISDIRQRAARIETRLMKLAEKLNVDVKEHKHETNS